MEETAPILELRDARKSFGALIVADGIGFSVDSGEVVGIIGPNGAGKSTLFNLITGVLRLDCGRILFAGDDITTRDPGSRCRGGIGRAYQIPQLFGRLTVMENLLVGGCFGRQLTEREVADDAVRILELTGMIERSNTMADDLGLLDRKRLELARALATSPQLLLLDEIAGGLTEAECATLITTIRAIHESGTTIIWIEHVLHALIAVVGRLMVLHGGEIIEDGEPERIMAAPSVKEIYLGLPA